MPLAPAAQQIVDAAAERFPGGMSAMPVAKLRAVLDAGAIRPSTAIHDRFDLVVPADTGGIPVRVYRPSADTELPVVQWMHSGGFVIGGLDQNDEYLRRLSNAANVVVVSVDYRLAPEHPYPAALQDARAVWEWIKSAPDELPARVNAAALAGESAGGVLTFALGQQLNDEDRPRPNAQVSFYGAAEPRISNPDLSTSLLSPADSAWFWDQYVPRVEDRNDPYVSPGRATNLSGLPPTLVVTAEVDATRDATEAYARRLQAGGVSVDLVRYDGMMHGFATMLSALEPAMQLFDRTVDFLHRYLHNGVDLSPTPSQSANLSGVEDTDRSQTS